MHQLFLPHPRPMARTVNAVPIQPELAAREFHQLIGNQAWHGALLLTIDLHSLAIGIIGAVFTVTTARPIGVID